MMYQFAHAKTERFISMKKTKLYDFSLSTALIVCLAYALLLALFGYTWATGGHSVVFGIIFILLVLSFLTVFVYFVIFAPTIKGKTISHGDKKIKKKDVQFKAAYDPRFKEKAVVFWDKKTEIKYVSKEDYKKKTIRVQATPANIRKIEEWLDCEITVPEKPQKARRK